MKCPRIPLILLGMLLVFVSAAGFAGAAETESKTAAPAMPTHLRFLTGPNGGQWFFLGEPIAEVLSRNVAPTSSRIGGGVSNIDAINKRLGDLGFSLACFMGAAESGEKEYQSIKTDNVVLMANVYPQVLYFLVRKEFAAKYSITSVGDLLKVRAPIRFAALKPGTASEFIVAMLLKYGYNTGFDQLREQGWALSFSNYAETADNFVAGELDCFAYTAGTSVPLIKTMEEHTEVLILPVEAPVLKLLSDKFKTGTYVIKTGDYKSVTAPIATLGDYTCIIARKDLSDDVIFAVNKALWDNREAIAAAVEDFGGLSPETALPQGLPAHPGSVRFWSTLKK